MKYSFSAKNPCDHFLSIRVESGPIKGDNIIVQLPSWRPGRYELGNFAKNVKDFSVRNEAGDLLCISKVSKDAWQVDCKGESSVIIEYNYYASELNAGATWLDENQLYVNPVNCCVYIVGKENEGCEILLDVPSDYKVATSLLKSLDYSFVAKDFQELADSPFIASPTLQHKMYESNDVKFHVWFQGEIKPDWDQLLLDFQRFTDFQIQQYGKFPVREYHFLNQITTYKSYHGVEHQKSTVVMLGPSYEVFNNYYVEFLGVSSHELYHTWNIKAIRPQEMQPYDFTKENYSKLGFVAEGVTTYMGDRVLYECGVFDLEQYFKEFETYLLRHYHNDGRKHYSVANSSWDTWLDGYVPGVPGRKTSIYTEGALIAYICDMRIRKNTNNEFTLHTVMKELYQFTENNGSYTEQNYKAILERVGGDSFDDIFQNLIHGTHDFTPYIKESLALEGWAFETISSALEYENLGIKGVWNSSVFEIINVKEDSSAELSGIAVGDKIHSVNGIKLNDDFHQWLNYFKEEDRKLSLERNGRLKKVTLKPENGVGFYTFKMTSK